MLKVSQLMRVCVFQPKRGRTDDPATLDLDDLSVVGHVRQVVFSPDGMRVVGLLARRPDVAGMIKRPDAFVALDSIVVGQDGLVVANGATGMDDDAVERLGLDWDACILWTGMDAKTTDGKELGWVDDVEFSPKSGRVKAFYVGDGSVAKSLVGSVVVPVDMLRGYKDGFMLVDPQAATLALNGGLAAKAGEGYARAKQGGKEAMARAGEAAGGVVEKGAYGLGRMIGKAKRAMDSDDASQPDEAPREDESAREARSAHDEGQTASENEPAHEDELVEYAPVKKKKAKKGAAHAVGKQLKRTRGMFGSFMDEYKKASK